MIFVGIGAGAIQLGLWAYYASLSGAEIILVEVDEEKIKNIKKNKNFYCINIAHFDRIESVRVGPVEIYNPNIKEEREKIVEAIKFANDITTALPSTSFYEKGGVARLLREGLSERRRPVTIYASENQIGAGKMLERLAFPKNRPEFIQFSETVIERMGGPHFDKSLINELGLKKIALRSKDALLVEDFDRIIIEKTSISKKYGYKSCFDKFFPVDNIMLYEELKLFGHNALHSLLGFIGKLKGYKFMSQYNGDSDFGHIGAGALIDETGPWFRRKYENSGEEITREAGYERWARQLCRRIVNPFLYDLVDRIIRDPRRKLGWDDRIVGTMRNALAYGITPHRYALGVAAALYQRNLRRQEALSNLESVWGNNVEEKLKTKILSIIGEAFEIIREWKESGEKSLYKFIERENWIKISSPKI